MLKDVIVPAVCLAAATAAVRADEKPIIPLRVQVTIARYQGDKKVSSLPYTLIVNAMSPAGPRAQMRMGSQVPIPSTTIGKDQPQIQSYQYRDIGINIDCVAGTVEDGRYKLDISIDDSSVYGDDTTAKNAVGAPSFRQFRVTEQVVLKDGQSREFIAATDKINGEVTKVEVSLSVVK